MEQKKLELAPETPLVIRKLADAVVASPIVKVWVNGKDVGAGEVSYAMSPVTTPAFLTNGVSTIAFP